MRSTLNGIACPTCRARLFGGPVRYTCSEGHGVSAADLYVEQTVITDPIVRASAHLWREAARWRRESA